MQRFVERNASDVDGKSMMEKNEWLGVVQERQSSHRNTGFPFAPRNLQIVIFNDSKQINQPKPSFLFHHRHQSNHNNNKKCCGRPRDARCYNNNRNKPYDAWVAAAIGAFCVCVCGPLLRFFLVFLFSHRLDMILLALTANRLAAHLNHTTKWVPKSLVSFVGCGSFTERVTMDPSCWDGSIRGSINCTRIDSDSILFSFLRFRNNILPTIRVL